MVNFNFYPWRDYELAYQKKITIRWLGLTLLFTGLALLILHVCVSRNKIELLNKNTLLKKELLHQAQTEKLNTNTTKNKKNNNSTREYPVHFVNQLFFEFYHERFDLCFTEISSQNQLIQLSGLTLTTNHLLELIGKNKVFALFSHIEIKHLEFKKNGQYYFILHGILNEDTL